MAAREEVQALAVGGATIVADGANLAVSDQVIAACRTMQSQLGTPDILMNNAASRAGMGWKASREEWRSLFEVNFWAIVDTVDFFMPFMLQKRGAKIVNVGSKQGITNPPGHPIYNISKSALKTYTEALEHDLRSAKEEQTLSAHLLVPGWTTTGDREHQPGAWLPEQVVERMDAALQNGDFYIICPDDEVSEDMDKRRIAWGAGDMIENRPPLSRWHPAYKEEAAKACD